MTKIIESAILNDQTAQIVRRQVESMQRQGIAVSAIYKLIDFNLWPSIGHRSDSLASSGSGEAQPRGF